MKTRTKLCLKFLSKLSTRFDFNSYFKKSQQSHSLIYRETMYFRESLCIYIYIHIVGNFAWRSFPRGESWIFTRAATVYLFVCGCNEIGGVLERIQRQFRGVYYRFVDGNFDVSMVKGICNISLCSKRRIIRRLQRSWKLLNYNNFNI